MVSRMVLVRRSAVKITVAVRTDSNNFSELVSFTSDPAAENTDEGVFYLEEIKIEKDASLTGGFEGGNISDLGGYYNELVYFTNCVKTGTKVEKATLKDAVESLVFVREEIRNA